MGERAVDVLIVGGGVIGVACALELAKRGVAVRLVERGSVGQGSSYGNAGWLTPCFATPLPAPGTLAKAIRWMADPESPLYIEPRPSPDLVRWLFGFARATSRRAFERGIDALLPLSRHSLDAYEAMAREIPEPFGFAKRGQLVLAQTEAGLAHAVEEGETMARRGLAHRVLDPEALRAMEPAATGPVAGGVYFPESAHVEPLEIVRAMAAEATRRGAEILAGTDVFELVREGDRITAVRTTRGMMPADRVLLATGAWSKPIARSLGLRLPVLGGKGYAVITTSVDPPPKLPIRVVERKIAITPRDGSVRLAGTLELVDGDESISPRRVDAILRGARTVLRLAEHPRIVEVWRGLRPCTPDGLPVIGFASRPSNLFIATGHQMLGLHTAPGTARLAADLLTGASPAFDPAPFRASRF